MTQEESARELVAAPEAAGERLDKWLAGQFDDLSRSRIQVLIREGAVTSNGRALLDPKEPVQCGLIYRMKVPPLIKEAEPAGQAIALNILHEDEHVLVLDKPAGLVVHPAAGNASGTLVNALIAHCGERLSEVGGADRKGIVHRLDKNTSGLLVVAKTDVAHHRLAEQFAAHGLDGRLHRAYRALAWGVPDRGRGRIEADLARSTQNRLKIAVVEPGEGRHAVTHFEVEQVFDTASGSGLVSLLRLVLETGRTHQIRVHMAHIRHPILGDPVYGNSFKASARRLDAASQAALKRLGRQALHAAELSFEHPVNGELLSFESPLPDDMAELIDCLEAADS